jgi:hypothetical protein
MILDEALVEEVDRAVLWTSRAWRHVTIAGHTGGHGQPLEAGPLTRLER